MSFAHRVLYEPIDTVLLAAGIAAVVVAVGALLLAGDERRVPLLIALGCGLGTCIIVLGAVNAWGPAHEKGRALFHTGLVIAVPLGASIAGVASRYTHPKLGLGWAVFAALGGVAALPLGAFLLITAACGGGQCS